MGIVVVDDVDELLLRSITVPGVSSIMISVGNWLSSSGDDDDAVSSLLEGSNESVSLLDLLLWLSADDASKEDEIPSLLLCMVELISVI